MALKPQLIKLIMRNPMSNIVIVYRLVHGLFLVCIANKPHLNIFILRVEYNDHSILERVINIYVSFSIS
jgi:hypothetical protein